MTNYKLQINNLQAGQSLFELTVAIAISALIVVAMVALATTAIKNSTYSKNKALASSYAQQATEWLRGERDSDVDTFMTTYAATGTWPAGYCLPDSSLNWNHWVGSVSINCTVPITGTIFKRWVTFKNVGMQNGKMVAETDVTVVWTDSGGLHEVTSATNFSDWK